MNSDSEFVAALLVLSPLSTSVALAVGYCTENLSLNVILRNLDFQ